MSTCDDLQFGVTLFALTAAKSTSYPRSFLPKGGLIVAKVKTVFFDFYGVDVGKGKSFADVLATANAQPKDETRNRTISGAVYRLNRYRKKGTSRHEGEVIRIAPFRSTRWTRPIRPGRYVSVSETKKSPQTSAPSLNCMGPASLARSQAEATRAKGFADLQVIGKEIDAPPLCLLMKCIKG